MPGRTLLPERSAQLRHYHQPDCVRRRAVLRDTLAAFVQAEAPDHYQRLAAANLARGQARAVAVNGPLRVEVQAGDWGEVTGAVTARDGHCFAVLNMANAYVPGGGDVEGLVAQEENMFRRTDCHFSIDDHCFDRARDAYHPAFTELLEAADGRVYLDTARPRVCLRGPEQRERPDLGDAWLAQPAIFPFYELRAAATDLRDGSPFSAPEMRRRIAAQLNTLPARRIRLRGVPEPRRAGGHAVPRGNCAPRGRLHAHCVRRVSCGLQAGQFSAVCSGLPRFRALARRGEM